MSSAYDILIVGAGYTGSLAALVMSRKGYKVLLVDAGVMPRFSVGESTTPEQNEIHYILGTELGIPELVNLSSYESIRLSQIPIPKWPKESFYFLFDKQNSSSDKPEELMFQATPWPIGPDYHCSRSEYDQYMLVLAIRYGAQYRGMSTVDNLNLDGPGISCEIGTSGKQEKIEARFLIDATGPGAWLATKLGYVDRNPSNIALRSRSIYSHFIGVKYLEDTAAKHWPKHRFPRDHATIHHIGDYGWAWVIPFDNGVTSVGVMVDMSLKEFQVEMGAADEFERLIRRQPALSAMMQSAQMIRPLVKTGQLQWSATKILGSNWYILPPASGFTDPFQSPGLDSVAINIARLHYNIDKVLRKGQPALEALEHLSMRHFREVEYVARLQHIMYLGFRSFRLFREAYTLYMMCVVVGSVKNLDRETMPSPQFPSMWSFDRPAIRNLVDTFYQRLTTGTAAQDSIDGLAQDLNAILHKGDMYGYLRSAFHVSEEPNVHVASMSHIRWMSRLERSGTTIPERKWFGSMLSKVGVHMSRIISFGWRRPGRLPGAWALIRRNIPMILSRWRFPA